MQTGTVTNPQRPDLGPDEVVVQRILGGESALYEVLVRRHNQRIFRAARAIVGDDVAEWLERAVDALPEAFSAVFVLRTLEDMSTSETAECLAIPEDTVKTRLFRARGILQRTLLDQAEGGRAGVYAFMGARCDRVTAKVLAKLFGVGTAPS